eukprot:gene54259-72511_t
MDYQSEYLSFRLVNLSEFAVKASYIVSVINVEPDKTISWSDPEGILTFQPINTGDNSWGPDDLIPLKFLNSVKS